MIETYEALLKSFAEHVGLDVENLLATQELVIEGLAVGLLYEGDESIGDLIYFADLGSPSERRAPEVYKTLLQANNLWVGTGGATLGVQQDSGHVILAGRIDVQGLTAQSLSVLLDAFTDTALFWQKFVADTLPSDAPGSQDQFIVRG